MTNREHWTWFECVFVGVIVLLFAVSLVFAPVEPLEGLPSGDINAAIQTGQYK